jgi:hypothetical protein
MSFWAEVDAIGLWLLLFGPMMCFGAGVAWLYSRGTSPDSDDFLSRFRRDYWSLERILLVTAVPLTLVGGIMFALGELLKR